VLLVLINCLNQCYHSIELRTFAHTIRVFVASKGFPSPACRPPLVNGKAGITRERVTTSCSLRSVQLAEWQVSSLSFADEWGEEEDDEERGIARNKSRGIRVGFGDSYRQMEFMHALVILRSSDFVFHIICLKQKTKQKMKGKNLVKEDGDTSAKGLSPLLLVLSARLEHKIFFRKVSPSYPWPVLSSMPLEMCRPSAAQLDLMAVAVWKQRR
jgi:hypothetical protein